MFNNEHVGYGVIIDMPTMLGDDLNYFLLCYIEQL